MYEDGIFSLEYYVNYGNGDTPNEKVTFGFGTVLPENTSLRLYYYKDGSFVWSGNLILSKKSDSVSVYDFSSMQVGNVFSADIRAGAKAERFRLVVTLPNNEKNFKAEPDGTQLTFSVERYSYKSTVTEYGDYLKENPVESPEKSGSCVGKLTLYPVVSRSVTENRTQLIYSVGTASDGVTDYRHEGSVYVWQVEKTAGGAIDYNAEKSVFVEVFGQNAELIVTTTGIYCSAENVKTINVSGLSGYTVSLLEVRNPQYPAAGAVLWSKNVS